MFDLKYVVTLPVYDVQVKINCEKYHEIEKEYTQTREKKTKTTWYLGPSIMPLHINKKKSTMITEEEQTRALDFLQETGVVTFNHVQHVPDADKEIVGSGLHACAVPFFV